MRFTCVGRVVYSRGETKGLVCTGYGKRPVQGVPAVGRWLLYTIFVCRWHTRATAEEETTMATAPPTAFDRYDAFCATCCASRGLIAARAVTVESGLLAVRGACPICKRVLTRIIGTLPPAPDGATR